MNIEKEIEMAKYHPLTEDIRNMLEAKLINNSSNYFRMVISFYLAQIATNMKAHVTNRLLGNLQLNLFVTSLMESGGGKSQTTNFLENEIICDFRKNFLEVTFEAQAKVKLDEQINNEKILNNLDDKKAYDKVMSEWNTLGTVAYSFRDGTSAAYQQMYSKLQLADIGALSLVVDEIGTNLQKSSLKEIIDLGLEAYDCKIKQKLLKNGSDNKRSAERFNPVPSNFLWFGTPTRLFDGTSTEDTFIELLITGYARRMLFGWGEKPEYDDNITGDEIRKMQLSKTSTLTPTAIRDMLCKLSSPAFYDMNIELQEPEEALAYDYKAWCEQRAKKITTYDKSNEAYKLELTDRMFKAVKLAGVYAFIDQTSNITKEQLLAAIKVVEDSGKCLKKILNRDPKFVRLAKFLVDRDNEGKGFTRSGLTILPYFPDSKAKQDELINLACEWGYDNDINIALYKEGRFDKFKGNTLKETDLNQLILSYSCDSDQSNIKSYDSFRRSFADGYQNVVIPFAKLSLFSSNGLDNSNIIDWCTHHLKIGTDGYGHRDNKNVLPKFNLVVIDIDGKHGYSTNIKAAQEILKDMVYFLHTTKSHQLNGQDCYRIIIPLKYSLELDEATYKQFTLNVLQYFPFVGVDYGTNDYSRKWTSHNGISYQNLNGELFDPRPFIPNTHRNEDRILNNKKYKDCDAISRWFLSQIEVGDRNNNLFKYGAFLLDSGLKVEEVEQKVIDLNNKLENPLTEDEIANTIIRSLYNRTSN